VILEIRTYRLVPGMRDEFVRLMRDVSVPIVLEASDVVVGALTRDSSAQPAR